jgi:hypothetical protein
MWQKIIDFINECWTAYGKAAMIEQGFVDDRLPQQEEEKQMQQDK